MDRCGQIAADDPQARQTPSLAAMTTLFDPIRIGDIKLATRICMAPLRKHKLITWTLYRQGIDLADGLRRIDFGPTSSS